MNKQEEENFGYKILRDLYIEQLDKFVNIQKSYNLLKESYKENTIINSMNDMRDLYNQQMAKNELQKITYIKIISGLLEYKKNTNDLITCISSIVKESLIKKDIYTKHDFINALTKIDDFVEYIKSDSDEELDVTLELDNNSISENL